jgi:glycosyltransferase involved in cell wall biosynthesis
LKPAARIAIVSDPLVQRGGGERVVVALAEAFPDAPIFTVLYSAKSGPHELHDRIRPSWLNRIPGAAERHRVLFPLYRDAVESFDLRAFDIIVSSHHTVAKGLLRNSGQRHVCYCHTPMRGIWERPNEEVEHLAPPLRFAVRRLFSEMRTWDVVTANQVDRFIANSRTTQDRIARHYRRESTIVYPPVNVDKFTPGGAVDDYYLVASRAVAHKRLDIAIAAAQLAGRRLILVGQRPKYLPVSENITFLGHVDDHQLVTLMRGARALLFPQLEDFGLTIVEMNACGRPVIAFGAGGALETVIDGTTGVLVREQSAGAFADGIRHFEGLTFDPETLRAHALQFEHQRFLTAVRAIVADAYAELSMQ